MPIYLPVTLPVRPAVTHTDTYGWMDGWMDTYLQTPARWQRLAWVVRDPLRRGHSDDRPICARSLARSCGLKNMRVYVSKVPQQQQQHLEIPTPPDSLPFLILLWRVEERMEVLDYVDSWISKLEICMDVCMYVCMGKSGDREKKCCDGRRLSHFLYVCM